MKRQVPDTASDGEVEVLHGSAVVLGSRGLLISGAAGCGKTRLALETIAFGAELVADDVVWLSAGAGQVMMAPPPTLAGVIELRGAGILRHPYRPNAPLWLAVDLDRVPDCRMPRPVRRRLAGQAVPVLAGGPALHAAMLVAILRTGRLPEPEFFPGGDEMDA